MGMILEERTQARANLISPILIIALPSNKPVRNIAGMLMQELFRKKYNLKKVQYDPKRATYEFAHEDQRSVVLHVNGSSVSYELSSKDTKSTYKEWDALHEYMGNKL